MTERNICSGMMKDSIKAYAKINIGLDITGKLDNGYHLLKSVMQQVDLYDVVTVEKTNNEGEILLSSNSNDIPLDETNIAFKAAKKMMDEYHLSGGVAITIDKRIPVAAGMAGGSTDAAAVLILINRIFEFGLDMDELCKVGVKLGADVPYCIMGKTALAEGIGEILSPIDMAPDMYVLIAKPPIFVSTKHVYENLHLDELQHPDMNAILRGYQDKDYGIIVNNLGNVLESVTAKEYSIIDELKGKMLSNGADGSLMSGSGPTVFGIYRDLESAVSAQDTLRKEYPDVFIKATGIIR